VSGGRVFGRMTRRVAFGMGVMGAAALLAACSPVKMGAAAIVGDQRISSSTLDTQVSNLQKDLGLYDPTVHVTPTVAAVLPKLVLTELISFQIRDQTAQDLGVTVSQADIDYALNYVVRQPLADGTHYASQNQMIVSQAVPLNLRDDFGRYYAIELDFLKNKNGGTLPTTNSAAVQQAVSQFSTAECRAAKGLNIQVNPMYGQLSFDQQSGLFAVVAGSDTLSAAGGKKPTTVLPYTPAC